MVDLRTRAMISGRSLRIMASAKEQDTHRLQLKRDARRSASTRVGSRYIRGDSEGCNGIHWLRLCLQGPECQRRWIRSIDGRKNKGFFFFWFVGDAECGRDRGIRSDGRVTEASRDTVLLRVRQTYDPEMHCQGGVDTRLQGHIIFIMDDAVQCLSIILTVTCRLWECKE